MSSLQDIRKAVKNAADYRYAALRYKKGDSSPGKGERFEECVLALVFLRCLREGLVFQLSANNGDAGKFDDLVLVWRRWAESESHMMCVQLKHRDTKSVQKESWLNKSSKFSLNKHSASYKSTLQEMDNVTCIMMTNSYPNEDSLILFKTHEMACVPGLGLLQTQGKQVDDDDVISARREQDCKCYKINADNEEAWEAVDRNRGFVEHFYLLCKQSDSVRIERDIYRELEELLGAGDQCGYICDSLCKSVRDWMNRRKRVCLTRDWSKWQEIVGEYVGKNVTGLGAATTGLKYHSVEGVWSYVKSCNPAWVRPPEGGTEILSATKIHQALADQTHIVADVKHFTQLRYRILHCWGPFCRWLVIVDDGRKDSAVVLDEMLELIEIGRRLVAESSTRNDSVQIKSLGGPCQSFNVSGGEAETERRLVIVSARENSKVENTIFDTFQSSDVTDDSWKELLDARVTLNGEDYQCRLRDLVARVNAPRDQVAELNAVKALKSLLDGRPALLLALARVSQLSQSLRMGQELETPPDYYVPMRLEDQHQVAADFLRTLRNGDVCFTDLPSFEALQRVISSRPVPSYSVMDVGTFQSWSLAPSEIQWPLIVWSVDLETVQEVFRKQRYFNSYLLKYYNNVWQMVYFFGDPERCRPYRRRNELQLKVLDSVASVVIVNGKPGMGKSMMLSHVVEEIQARQECFWIIRISLIKFYTVLKKTGSAKTVTESILKATLFNKDELGDLEYELLQHCLSECERVVCLVDGFDEVSAKSVDKCLQVLQLLAPRRGKLVVTTRPGMVKLLESRMGVFAHSLVPFSDSELEAFLKKYPSNRKITFSRLSENVRDLLRIPLYAVMYAKLSQEETEGYNIVTLYDAFFREKYKRLREEKFNQDLSIDELEREVQVAQKKHERDLMLLAAYCLLGKRYRYVPEDPQLVERVGIVYAFVDGRPVFEHRTFAEHFLAKWCFREAKLGTRWLVYRKAYQKQTAEFFLATFDCMAVRDCELLEVVMEALLGGATTGAVERLLQGGADPGQVDVFGRGALHLVAVHDSPQAVSLVHLLRRHAGSGALSRVDRLLWLTPVRYAAEHGLWAFMEVLLTGAVRGALHRVDRLFFWTPVRYAAEHGRWAVVAALLTDGGDIAHLADFCPRTLPPGELRAVFEQCGYRALFERVIESKHPLGNDLEDQTEFAVSLAYGDGVPLRLLKDIGEKAEEEGHVEVGRLLLGAYDRRIRDMRIYLCVVFLLFVLMCY